jgi:hypothetical protein
MELLSVFVVVMPKNHQPGTPEVSSIGLVMP